MATFTLTDRSKPASTNPQVKKAKNLASEFYSALKSAGKERARVKHQQLVNLIVALLDDNYTTQQVADIMSAHYRTGEPWTEDTLRDAAVRLRIYPW